MRYALGILFILFFVGFVACTFLLGGPPSQVYELRDIILGGALVCVTLSAVVLGMLVLGIGAKGRKIASWRVPLLCLAALLVSVVFGVFILTLEPLDMSAQNLDWLAQALALESRLRICAFMMIAFGLFSLSSLIVALILAKRHNSKLALTE